MSEKDKSAGIRTSVRKVKVTEDSAGQRVDNFVMGELKGLPRNRVYRLLRKGEIRINGKRATQSTRLESGDEVRLPPVTLTPDRPIKVSQSLSQKLLDSVLFEDKRVLVINKPSGVAVHGGSGVSAGVVEALRAARPDLKDLGLVHRLDRETSGCLVMAKKRSALRALHADFREGRVEKRYLAGCIGHWDFGQRTCRAPLEVRNRKGGERHVVVSDSGKESATRFAPQAFYDGLTLLSAEPLTGRTHQIRVHANHVGHPLAGDERYGDPDLNWDLKQLGLPRLFLHAQSISFSDDSGNEQLYNAPLPDDLERFLGKLRRQQ
ncbi:MAG: RluA family pseudouridine synthase [Pseudomonadota bacterium]